MNAEIDFDQDRISADELQLLRTKQAILQKLHVIFDQGDKKKNLRAVSGNGDGTNLDANIRKGAQVYGGLRVG